MSRKIFAAVFVIVICLCGNAFAASRTKSQQVYKGRNIPSDPMLPSYENPTEVDIAKGKIHISFKGAFRAIDDKGRATDWVYFMFEAKAQEDMYFGVEQSELFDGEQKTYMYRSVPRIGEDRTFGREIIASVNVPVILGVNMPLSEAGELPSISRVTFTFNKEKLEYRNVKVEEWDVWEEMQEGYTEE